jgi:hypothetical protein
LRPDERTCFGTIRPPWLLNLQGFSCVSVCGCVKVGYCEKTARSHTRPHRLLNCIAGCRCYCHACRIDSNTRGRMHQRRTRMGIRAALNLRPVTALALLGLVLTCASLPARAQQWTPQQRAACEPDAMRLCNQYVPDVQRVSACMSHYRRYLSPACRAVFQRRGRR